MKKISIIIPAYREEKNIFLVYSAIRKILSSIGDNYDYEMIFVNDGSSDNTWIEILKITNENKKVKAINLSRNFGHQQALSAGYMQASGDLIISMDADMQDPPILILNMVKEWEKGNEIVYARRIERKDRFLKKYTAILYYKILSKVSDTKIPRDVGDFRLIDKKVLEVFKLLKEKDRYIRGMFAWMGYKISFVEYKRPEREFGESGYSWNKMIKLAMDGILNFSTFPLKMGAIIGFFIIILSSLFFLYITYDFFINEADYPLYKWINVVLLGFMGLQFIFMWILGEYIGRIYNETRERPLYIISEKINFDKKIGKKS
ncbi:MAG: glycosyltransferase family 2 protein [Candidatus Gracilibacteria bacterium]|nr:glycosyltransferase family 2 protein [Candidatus Gracilibacteria bacterium]